MKELLLLLALLLSVWWLIMRIRRTKSEQLADDAAAKTKLNSVHCYPLQEYKHDISAAKCRLLEALLFLLLPREFRLRCFSSLVNWLRSHTP